jgi:predicted RNase H-like HicB family nuclease
MSLQRLAIRVTDGQGVDIFSENAQSVSAQALGGETRMTEFHIVAEWDSDAELWVATSPDIPGLVLQGRTHDDLVEKLRLVVPALIEIGVDPEDRLNVRFCKIIGKEEVRSLPIAA